MIFLYLIIACSASGPLTTFNTLIPALPNALLQSSTYACHFSEIWHLGPLPLLNTRFQPSSSIPQVYTIATVLRSTTPRVRVSRIYTSQCTIIVQSSLDGSTVYFNLSRLLTPYFWPDHQSYRRKIGSWWVSSVSLLQLHGSVRYRRVSHALLPVYNL